MVTAASTALDVHVDVLQLVQRILFGFVAILAGQELHLDLLGRYSGGDVRSRLVVPRITELRPRFAFRNGLGHQSFFDFVRAYDFFLFVVLVPTVFRNDPVVADQLGLRRRQGGLLQMVLDLIGPARFDQIFGGHVGGEKRKTDERKKLRRETRAAQKIRPCSVPTPKNQKNDCDTTIAMSRDKLIAARTRIRTRRIGRFTGWPHCRRPEIYRKSLDENQFCKQIAFTGI